MKYRFFLSLLVFFLFLAFFHLPLFAEAGEKPSGILVDVIHCNEHSDIGLQEDNTDYHHICGSRLGFDYIKSRGIRCDRLTEGRITEEILSKYELLFINLLSADRPGFLVSEVQAIVRFIESGGSLLVVTDHSNCYFHANMLEPIFTELDIETKRSTVCERSPYTIGTGPGWFLISNFEEHPITDGLRFLGVQTGGEVDARFAVAWSSWSSWADKWFCAPYLRNTSPGFYGNFEQDDDEPTGKLGVLLAKEFGKGRIVIFNDQNMISDTFINYADNYRLWLNTFSWLLRNESLADVNTYGNWRPDGYEKESLWIVESFDRPDFGCANEHNMYNSWVLLNRYFLAFAYDRRPRSDCQLAIIVDGYNLTSQETFDDLTQFLREGNHLLALHTPADVLDEPDSTISEILQALDEKNRVAENCSSEFFNEFDKIEEINKKNIEKNEGKQNESKTILQYFPSNDSTGESSDKLVKESSDELPDRGTFCKIRLQTGGTITLFEGSKHFSNNRIPHSTDQPREDEAAHIRLFLHLVRKAVQP